MTRENSEDQYIRALKTKYKVVPAEKYPDAIVKLHLDQAKLKFVGNKKIKQRMVDRMSKYIQEKIKISYGKYATMSNLVVKDGGVKFHTNFHLIFKVKDENHNLGYLYGSDMTGICDGILFTEHSLQRFEQRAVPFFYETAKTKFKDQIGNEPTVLDVLAFTMTTKEIFEYGKYNDLLYLNVHTGILVLERIEDIYIAKTYLTPGMLNTPVTWYRVKQRESPYIGAHTFFSLECEEIKDPVFFGNRSLKEFIRLHEKIKDGNVKDLQKLMKEFSDKDYSQDIEDLENNFNKFKQFMFHPEILDKKAFFNECLDLSFRFRNGPIVYYRDLVSYIIEKNAD
jgi:hypothetical protein